MGRERVLLPHLHLMPIGQVDHDGIDQSETLSAHHHPLLTPRLERGPGVVEQADPGDARKYVSPQYE